MSVGRNGRFEVIENQLMQQSGTEKMCPSTSQYSLHAPSSQSHDSGIMHWFVFFEGKLQVKKITIGTEQLGEEGQVRNVSTIEITVTKPA